MRRGFYFSTVFALVWFWSAIAVAQVSAGAGAGTSQPTNVGQYEIELRHYKDSGQYDRDLAAVVDQAKKYLSRRLIVTGSSRWFWISMRRRSRTGPKINADDFVRILDGPCYDLPRGPCGTNAWLSMAHDQAIAPTLELYLQARRQGVAVFFITGRHEGLRDPTVRNLHDVGYDSWSDLVMEPDCLTTPSAAYFKAPARGKIAEKGYTIVVNVGDQASDLLGGYAERTFKLPNPFYVIP